MFIKKLRFLFFPILSLYLIHCSTSIRVYRPYPKENPFEVVKTIPSLIILTPKVLPERFAYYSPFLFTFKGVPFLGVEYDLQNEYGSLSYLIRKELSIRPENYPILLAEGGKIEIKEFILESIDSCYTNDVNIRLKAEIQIGVRKVETFEYADQIKSHVTDCILTLSAITIVPLIWYTPYSGYRGNREDQLNQLGRNGIETFFSFLEKQSGMSKTSINPTNKQSTPPVDPIRDPKIKEIMDNL